jgi:hypothetical protein
LRVSQNSARAARLGRIYDDASLLVTSLDHLADDLDDDILDGAEDTPQHALHWSFRHPDSRILQWHQHIGSDQHPGLAQSLRAWQAVARPRRSGVAIERAIHKGQVGLG